jgi:hypothetical protein
MTTVIITEKVGKRVCRKIRTLIQTYAIVLLFVHWNACILRVIYEGSSGKSPAGISERGNMMNEPTITCPNCQSEVKLTESLAAPLIEATRLQFEHKIAEKEAEIAKRETVVHEQKAAIEKARETVDDQVSQKLKAERQKIICRRSQKGAAHS